MKFVKDVDQIRGGFAAMNGYSLAAGPLDVPLHLGFMEALVCNLGIVIERQEMHDSRRNGGHARAFERGPHFELANPSRLAGEIEVMREIERLDTGRHK